MRRDDASAAQATTEALAAALRPELEILRAIGGGSTADVYLAREPALKRLVAVKALRAELAADDIVRRRFAREAQAAARIAHPNITTIHRVGSVAASPGAGDAAGADAAAARRGAAATDIPYIVMEYIDGRTVRDVLDSVGAFAVEEAVPLLAAVASALAAVHERGVVHRDVRPDNVYIENGTGRAVLGDFGLAGLLDSGSAAVTRLTAIGVRLGDARYESPEQVRGETATEQSDVYAFGLLAYEVLTGRGPYDARTDAEHVVAHSRAKPRPLHAAVPALGAATAGLLERCLQKQPGQRPRARDVARRLSASGADGGASPDEERGALGQFLDELGRRRVYRVLVAYGAFAAAVLGTMQAVADAFDIATRTYRVIVVATLGGLPVAVVLGWIYDVTGGRIRRTHATADARRLRAWKLIGLAASALLAAAVGWLLLRGR